MYTLYIGNKNYSSWSLRAWILMKELGIAFNERLVPFNVSDYPSFASFSPSAKVPCVHDGATRVWDTLAITEYLAEKHPGVWPEDRMARAWARCVAAEMHSGFTALRNTCSMSAGIRVQLHSHPPELRKDLERIAVIFSDGLHRFRGPFLAGERFTAADAFYCPVAFRVQTYGLELPPVAMKYVQRLLALEGMREWYEAALRETWRDAPHEEEIQLAGRIVEDLRIQAVAQPA
jgi:glutathione S-transferase